MTLSSSSSLTPLDLSVSAVRSADHDREGHPHQLQQQALQMRSGQAAAGGTRRDRRGRRRARSSPVATPTTGWSDPAALLPRQSVLDTGATESADEKGKRTSWRMDTNSPVSVAAEESGHGAATYGRRAKTGIIPTTRFISFIHSFFHSLEI